MGKRYTLPYPPSVNALFTNRRGGRSRTKAYDAWLYEAGVELLRQGARQLTGPVAVYIDAYLPDKRVRDIDNICKPCLDIATKRSLIDGDDWRTVQYVGVSYQGIDRDNPRVELSITPIQPVREAEGA